MQADQIMGLSLSTFTPLWLHAADAAAFSCSLSTTPWYPIKTEWEGQEGSTIPAWALPCSESSGTYIQGALFLILILGVPA